MFPFPIICPNPGYTLTHTVSADTSTPYNIYTAAQADGWDTVLPLIATVTINAGKIQGSDSTSTPAFSTGGPFPVGSVLVLVINGKLEAAGGAGALGGNVGNNGSGRTGYDGSNGGDALYATADITVVNTSGIILAGGGGGGGGACLYGESAGSGGGGGQGYAGGAAGSRGVNGTGAVDGTAGTASAFGTGGAAGGLGGGAGGDGGAAGANGSNGTDSVGSHGGFGGSAGRAVVGKAYVNSGVGIAVGTVTGAQV